MEYIICYESYTITNIILKIYSKFMMSNCYLTFKTIVVQLLRNSVENEVVQWVMRMKSNNYYVITWVIRMNYVYFKYERSIFWISCL